MQLLIASLQNKGLLQPLIFVIVDFWIALMFGTLPLLVLCYYFPGFSTAASSSIIFIYYVKISIEIIL